MSEDNKQAAGANPEGLRDVPSDIVEYKKFVAEGGHEHNAGIRSREAAEQAARDAGLTLASGEDDQQHKPHKNGFQARVNRLQRKIGERDQQIADLTKRLSAQPNGGAPPASPDAAKPAAAAEKPAGGNAKVDGKTLPRPEEKDFKTYSEYVEALTDWKTDRKLEAAEAKRSEQAGQSERDKASKAITDAHNARVDEAKTRYPDWEKSFDGLTDDSFTDPMVIYIFESERGPDITYYLATHREELKRIRDLTPLKQAAALGRIEDQLEPGDEDHAEGEDKGEKPAKAAKPAKPAADEGEDDEEEEDEDKKPAARKAAHSKAPPPAKPLGGRGGADDAMPDPKDFVAYEKWSRRQQAKAAKK